MSKASIVFLGKSSTADIAKALTGDYRREHLFVLGQELSFYQMYQTEIKIIDAEIEQCLISFAPQTLAEPPTPKRKRRKKPTANHPNFDLRQYLYRIAGVDLEDSETLCCIT